MKYLALGLVFSVLALTGCSQITMLRTQEMENVGANVQSNVIGSVDSSMKSLEDSLRQRIDSLGLESLQTRRLACPGRSCRLGGP